MDEKPKLTTLRQVARQLRIPRTTLNGIVERLGVGYQLGNQIVLTPADIEKIRAERKKNPRRGRPRKEG